MQETNICASAHWVPLGAANLHAEGARAKDGEGKGAKESRLFVCLFFPVTYLMQGFPGGSVVKKLPAHAGDIGSKP